MSDRKEGYQEFSFSAEDFGIVSTQELAAETFLNSNPEDIQFIRPEPTKKKNEQEEESTVEKKKEEKKKVIEEEPKKELSQDDMFSAMEKKSKEISDDAPEEESTEEGEEEEEEGNVYNSIGKELLAQGIFTLDEDESEEDFDTSTPEELLERFRLQSRKNLSEIVEKFLGRYGDDYRDMFDSIFVKGVRPEDYLSRYTKIQSVKGLDLADEGNQERIVRELYRSEGRSSEYIEKKITQLKNYNDLHEESSEAQRILIEREEKNIQDEIEKREADITRKQQIKAEYVNSMNRILSDKLKNKEFDGIPVDRKLAEQTFAYITQERFQTPDKKLLTTFDKDLMDLDRPENHELKVKIAILLQMAKEDPKLTKLANKAVSKETNNLFQGLKKNAIKAGQGKESQKEKEEIGSWFPQNK